MSDVTIFIVGLFVFGLSIASTFVLVCAPSRQEVQRRRKSLEENRRNFGYVSDAAENL